MSVFTEDDAGTIWCPRLPRTLDERTGTLADSSCCRGSVCMWWRWAYVDRDGRSHPASTKHAADLPALTGAGWVGGYCGAAGRPA